MARPGTLRVPESSDGTGQTCDPAGERESRHHPCRSGGCIAIGNAVAAWCCCDVFHEELVAPKQGLSGGCDSRGWFDPLVRTQAQRRGSRRRCHCFLVVQAPRAIAHTENRWMDCDRRNSHSRYHRSLSAASDSHRLALTLSRQLAPTAVPSLERLGDNSPFAEVSRERNPSRSNTYAVRTSRMPDHSWSCVSPTLVSR